MSLHVLNVVNHFKSIFPLVLAPRLNDSAYSNLHFTVKGRKTEDGCSFPC